MSEGGHSLLAPSAAHRWIPCPGSIALTQGEGGGGNFYAAEGTVAHWLGEQALRSNKDCIEWVGEVRTILGDDPSERWEIEIDDEMASYVQVYIDYCRRQHEENPGAITIEQRVDLSDVLGVPDQGGTADCVLQESLIVGRLEVVDLKYGTGVQVFAEGNEQLMLYALGALHEAESDGETEFEEVHTTIGQPRLDHLDSVMLTPAELREFGNTARHSALQAMEAIELHESGESIDEFLNPGAKQCQWCPAKADCPALAAEAIEAFDDLDEEGEVMLPEEGERLAELAAKVPMIESWCKAVMARVGELTERGEMPGWKLVAGRRGARKWSDPEAVEKLFKSSFRLKIDKMYKQELISPTQAEKILTEKRWEKVQHLIDQAEGKPKAVPESEPGEPIQPVTFEDVDELEADDLSDLL